MPEISFSWVAIDGYRLLETLFSVFEIVGCKNLSATIVMIAMSARMSEYSTKPWPRCESRSRATHVCTSTKRRRQHSWYAASSEFTEPPSWEVRRTLAPANRPALTHFMLKYRIGTSARAMARSG